MPYVNLYSPGEGRRDTTRMDCMVLRRHWGECLHLAEKGREAWLVAGGDFGANSRDELAG